MNSYKMNCKYLRQNLWKLIEVFKDFFVYEWSVLHNFSFTKKINCGKLYTNYTKAGRKKNG